MKILRTTYRNLIFCLCIGLVNAAAQTNEFTYQGRLTDSGTPSATYDFEFRLCASESDCPTPLQIKERLGVTVTNGSFTVKLDFDAAHFTGADRFLEISVRRNSGESWMPLNPRQKITSSPYAIKSLNADMATNATNATTAQNALQLGGIVATGFIQNTTSPQSGNFNITGDGTVSGTLSGNILNATQFNLNGNRILGVSPGLNNLFAGIGAGQANTNGLHNAFFGRAAGATNSIGSGNSFLGAFAGNLNNSGSNNTMIGSSAGANNTLGSDNTLIGANTNVLSGGLSFATAIGSGASVSTSNTIALGRNDGSDAVQIPGNLNISGAISGNGAGLTNVPGALKWQTVSGLAQQAQPNTGYLATNDAQVTITLPQNLAVGEIVRVSGAGIGGWKIALNEGQSIIGTGINFAPPIWTPHENIRNWESVASSADGTKLVAVVQNGQIYTSTDSGENWIPRESNREWSSVASSVDGTKLVATVNFGQIYTSTDSGATWTPRESGRSWFSVASSADGIKLVAVATSGQIYTSTDSGANWIARAMNNTWVSVASSADGTKLVAANGVGSVFVSTDSGVNWQITSPPLSGFGGDWRTVASSADGTKFAVAGGYRQIYTSVNSGGNWMPRGPDNYWNAIASSADGARLVAVTETDQIYVSMDSGASWTGQESTRNWRSVASSADGTKLVAVARGGRIYTAYIPSPLTTTPGTTGFLTGKQYSSIELQYIGNGKFIPIGSVGAITGF